MAEPNWPQPDQTAREQGNAGEDTGDSGSADYGADGNS